MSPALSRLARAAIQRFRGRIIGFRQTHDLRRRLRSERPLLEQARTLYEKSYVLGNAPLISVTIPTYNRGDLLVRRTLPSVLQQTYSQFEVIVVGDGCTDNTGQQIQRLSDSRIRFINLPQRAEYPTNPKHRWMVAGVPPVNRALDEAGGSWIAHLDDDDVFAPEHLETLLKFAQEGHHEFVYSQMNKQTGPDSWKVIGSAPTDRWNVPHSSAFFRSYLRLFKFDVETWKIDMPTDRHIWRRMADAGVRAGFMEKVTTSSPLRPGTTSYSHWAEDRV